MSAALLLLALTASSSLPDQHDYRVAWPDVPPRGVVVFLHGVSLDPFDEEREGMEELAKRATDRGFVAIFPVGLRVCDFSPKDVERCWLLDQVDDELADVRRIVHQVQRENGFAFRERYLIGFSNGGYLVANAVQHGMLADFTRVGIIAGGPVGDLMPASLGPEVFIEVGRDDHYTIDDTRKLAGMLKSRARYRETDGGHAFDADRAARFLEWFWDST